MAPDEYNKALDKSLSDLESRVQQRFLLNAEIAGLKETVRVLSSRVQMSSDKRKQVAQLIAMVDSATPSLTDAVRALLTRKYPRTLTAVEVRNALEDSSNFDDFSNSLSACHAALKRMLVDGDVELGPERNGKATYARVLRLDPPQSYPNVFAEIARIAPPFNAANAYYEGFAGRGLTPLDADDPARKLGEKTRFPKAPVPPASMRKKLGLDK